MFNFEGPQNDLRNRYTQPSIPMDDMPYKPGNSPEEIAEGARLEWEAEQKKRAANAKRQATRAANAKKRSATPPSARRRSTTPATRSKMAKVSTTRHPKPLPKLGAKEKPRDARGRWVKVGAALWSGAKAAGRAIGGTAKGVKKAHKTIKRVNADMKRGCMKKL